MALRTIVGAIDGSGNEGFRLRFGHGYARRDVSAAVLGLGGDLVRPWMVRAGGRELGAELTRLGGGQRGGVMTRGALLVTEWLRSASLVSGHRADELSSSNHTWKANPLKNLTRRITVGLATAALGAFAAAALSAPTVASASGGGLVDVDAVHVPINVEVKDVANHLADVAKILG